MPNNQQPTIRPNTGNNRGNGKRRDMPRPINSVEWAGIDNQLLRDAVCAVTATGAAILLSVTSDKGAYSIQVLDGDSRVREYPHSVESCEETLRWLISMFTTD